MSRSYIARVFGGPKALIDDNPGRWFPLEFNVKPTLSGVAMSPEAAERLAAVFACVRVIAETAAMLPLHIYRRLPKGGKERAPDHPIYRLVHDQPNPWQTAFEFWEMYLGHLVLRGEAFAQKIYTRSGQLGALIPLHPGRIRPRIFPDGTFVYEYVGRAGRPERVFQPEELMRTLAFSCDGVSGRSPIQVCRESFGLGIAAEQFGASFLGKGMAPSGYLTLGGKLSKDTRDRLQADVNAQSGSTQTGRTLILEDGMTWTQVGMKLTDAQYIELRKFSVTETARIFRVPPHKIMDLDRSTNNNIEHQGLEFTSDCEMPWLRRLEQTIWRDLIDPEEQSEFFAEFLVDGLLRGDLQSRYAAYATGRQWGWLNVDEIREKENMNPLPNGEGQTYLAPMNMVPADQITKLPAKPPAKAPTEERQQAAALLQDPLHRMARRESQIGREAFKKGGIPAVLGIYDGHPETMRRSLQPVLLPCAALLAIATNAALPSAPVLTAFVTQVSEEYARQAIGFWQSRSWDEVSVEAAWLEREREMPAKGASALAGGLLQLLSAPEGRPA